MSHPAARSRRLDGESSVPADAHSAYPTSGVRDVVIPRAPRLPAELMAYADVSSSGVFLSPEIEELDSEANIPTTRPCERQRSFGT